MKKLILTVGLPASGKTTWAKQLLKDHPNTYKRVNRDSLRLMLDDTQFNPKRERFITKVQRQLILSALDEGYHVVVDDTNLNPKTVRSLTELVKGRAKVEFKSFKDVSLETCLERDMKRTNSVGEKVIRKFHDQYFPKAEVEPYPYDENLPDCIICDLDGTLSLMTTRGPFEFLRCIEDDVNEPVRDILKSFSDGSNWAPKIILMSGRDGIAKLKTEGWLSKHNIGYDELHMRTAGDSRKDSIVKEELFDANIRGKYNVKFVLDDRNQVVDKWREMGLTCLQCAPGDF